MISIAVANPNDLLLADQIRAFLAEIMIWNLWSPKNPN